VPAADDEEGESRQAHQSNRARLGNTFDTKVANLIGIDLGGGTRVTHKRNGFGRTGRHKGTDGELPGTRVYIRRSHSHRISVRRSDGPSAAAAPRIIRPELELVRVSVRQSGQRERLRGFHRARVSQGVQDPRIVRRAGIRTVSGEPRRERTLPL
jgi:hypothetical protein